MRIPSIRQGGRPCCDIPIGRRSIGELEHRAVP
jgi:hypothetical protein